MQPPTPPLNNRHTHTHTHTHNRPIKHVIEKIMSKWFHVYTFSEPYSILHVCASRLRARDRICTTKHQHTHTHSTALDSHVRRSIWHTVRCGKHVTYIISHFVEHVRPRDMCVRLCHTRALDCVRPCVYVYRLTSVSFRARCEGAVGVTSYHFSYLLVDNTSFAPHVNANYPVKRCRLLWRCCLPTCQILGAFSVKNIIR